MPVSLKFDIGKRIATIKGGSKNGTVIYLYDDDYKCCTKCSDKCEIKKCCSNCSVHTYHNKISDEYIHDLQNKLKNKFKVDEIINDNDEVINEINLNGGKFQQVPSNFGRDLIYVSGRQGSGKTFYIAHYLEEFKKYYPKIPIYLFSAKKEDKLLDDKINKRIDVAMVKDAQFEAQDFKNCLVIFDDVDSLPDDKNNNIKKSVYDIMTDIIEVGRSLNVHCIITSHLAANNNESKRILNGCNSLVFFNNSSTHSGDYALKNYFDRNKNDISKLFINCLIIIYEFI